MDKNDFLEMLYAMPGWDNMIQKGGAGVHLNYKGVDFLIYRDDALHFLKYVPSDKKHESIIHEFNSLLEECREEIKSELDKWNMVRLTRDDDEGDKTN